MIEILGIKMTYDAVAFMLLFAVSELLPFIPQLKGNGIVEQIIKFSNVSKSFRREDDKIARIREQLKEIQKTLKG